MSTAPTHSPDEGIYTLVYLSGAYFVHHNDGRSTDFVSLVMPRDVLAAYGYALPDESKVIDSRKIRRELAEILWSKYAKDLEPRRSQVLIYDMRGLGAQLDAAVAN